MTPLPYEYWPPKGAFNSLRASRWTIWMAKIFGTRHVNQDSGYETTFYVYRGKHYLTDFRRCEPQSQRAEEKDG